MYYPRRSRIRLPNLDNSSVSKIEIYLRERGFTSSL